MPFQATFVAENGYFLSPFSATFVAVFGDELRILFVSVFGDFCRQCGQVFTLNKIRVSYAYVSLDSHGYYVTFTYLLALNLRILQ